MDPHIRADQTVTVWLPQVDSALALLTRLPAGLFTSPDLAHADPSLLTSAPEGDYLRLLALTPPNTALLLSGALEGAIAFVLPFDELFEERIEVARRLHRLLAGRRAPPISLSPHRRRRLKLALRALDGSLAGAEYRAIGEARFGDRVPRGAAFRDDSLRGQAIRLVRYGLQLMRGGYLELLRPTRRKP